jgi:hypothetical protein
MNGPGEILSLAVKVPAAQQIQKRLDEIELARYGRGAAEIGRRASGDKWPTYPDIELKRSTACVYWCRKIPSSFHGDLDRSDRIR